jgi:integrase/recombinase XerD
MQQTIQDFIESLNNRGDYSARTRQAYASDLKLWLMFLQRHLGRTANISDLTPENVQAFLRAELEAGHTQSTLQRRLATLRNLSLYLYARKLLPAPLGRNAQFTQVIHSAQPKGTGDCLQQEHIDELWAAFAEDHRPIARRDKAICALLLQTALSVGALIRLNLTHIDLRSGRIHIPKSVPPTWFPTGPANLALKTYVQIGRPELIRSVHEQALFISQMGGRMTRQGIWQMLRKWGRIINLPFTLTPRILRHTAVVRLRQEGYSSKELQTVLGHINPLSTKALIKRLEQRCGEVNVNIPYGDENADEQ